MQIAWKNQEGLHVEATSESDWKEKDATHKKGDWEGEVSLLWGRGTALNSTLEI